MKKTKLLALSLAAVVLLTGCGTKTLTCTRSNEYDGLEMEDVWKIKYDKENEIKKVELSAKYTLTDDDKEDDWEEFVEDLEDDVEDMKDDIKDEKEKGIKISSKSKKKSFELVVKLDSKKASDDMIDKFYDNEMDVEELEEYLEDMGYKCK